jgi:hypothetical protein
MEREKDNVLSLHVVFIFCTCCNIKAYEFQFPKQLAAHLLSWVVNENSGNKKVFAIFQFLYEIFSH